MKKDLMNHPRLPNIGDFVRHFGRLVGIEKVPPPPPPQPPPKKDYIFVEISARCELRFNGETIKELQELSDFYGLETSVSCASWVIDRFTLHSCFYQRPRQP